ncbi:unnamed protein product [Brachionus calyciflorus]|uniref:Tetratricopeptide repeat protein 1 n=1 Tax=Brachionus calyciflorus TaxID=104777 RepID=A0A813WD89_9BILA|nr:unnamed protein product [Brachionus calyciflorus]
MSSREENSDSEFYDACDNIEKVSDDEDFISIKPNYSSLNSETNQDVKNDSKFIPLHEELNEKMKIENDDDEDKDEEKLNLEANQDDDPFYVDENLLKNEQLTNEQKEERLKEAQEHKTIGNDLFKQEKYLEALESYTKSLRVCPLDFAKERSIFYSNRSACFFKIKDNERCVAECTKSLEFDASFVKPLLRRAECYQLMDKLDECLEDYKKLAELEPKTNSYKMRILELDARIKERNEKMKEEMMSKLKDLGNLVLKPFGLSTENFQFVQDQNTGSYSVNFKK